jgi:hypothetical protein
VIPVEQITLPKPTGVEYDPYSPDVWITQVGPPPGIRVWHENLDGSATFEVFIPLPADSDPGAASRLQAVARKRSRSRSASGLPTDSRRVWRRLAAGRLVRMVNFKRLSDRAKKVVDKRGGMDSLKEDAGELRDIARGKGTLKDKAKAAGEAVKEPGAKREEEAPPKE